MAAPVTIGYLWPDGTEDAAVVSPPDLIADGLPVEEHVVVSFQAACAQAPEWVACDDPVLQTAVAGLLDVPGGAPDGWGAPVLDNAAVAPSRAPVRRDHLHYLRAASRRERAKLERRGLRFTPDDVVRFCPTCNEISVR